LKIPAKLRRIWRKGAVATWAREQHESGPPHGRVELVYWRPAQGDNFGDFLSQVVTTKVLADAGHFIGEGTSQPQRLLAIGSILHLARDGDHIWGSGVNGKIKEDRYRFKRLHVHAVRGPLTREFLMKRGIPTPEIYGDPALLLPRLLQGRFRPSGDLPFVLVPNLNDLPLIRSFPNVVSPMLPWNSCIEQIIRGRFVIASSLHGLIIAEAFGLPARLLRLSERENLFKFEDYALGTGRPSIEFATSIDEAIEMGGMPPIRFDPQPLLDAFPIDLWRSSAQASPQKFESPGQNQRPEAAIDASIPLGREPASV
jgi:pyruvyltransferase